MLIQRDLVGLASLFAALGSLKSNATATGQRLPGISKA